MNNGRTIGIEKHHLELGADSRSIVLCHRASSFRKQRRKQLTISETD